MTIPWRPSWRSQTSSETRPEAFPQNKEGHAFLVFFLWLQPHFCYCYYILFHYRKGNGLFPCPLSLEVYVYHITCSYSSSIIPPFYISTMLPRIRRISTLYFSTIPLLHICECDDIAQFTTTVLPLYLTNTTGDECILRWIFSDVIFQQEFSMAGYTN